METTPVDTAKAYALTAQGECTITITQGDRSVSWTALTDGGQTTFIVPAKAIAHISDPGALLSPLPFPVAPERKSNTLGGEKEMSIADTIFTPHSLLPQSGTAVATLRDQLQEAAFARTALPGNTSVPTDEEWLAYGRLIPHAIVGGTAVYDLCLSNFSENSVLRILANTTDVLEVAPGFAVTTRELRFGLGRTDIEKMYITLGKMNGGNSSVVINAPNADVVFTSSSNTPVPLSNIKVRAYASIAKRIRIFAPSYNSETYLLGFSNFPAGSQTPTSTPTEVYLPACTSATSIGSLSSSYDYIERNYMPLKLFMPSLNKSCDFCSRMAMSSESLVYFLTHVGTLAAYKNGGTLPRSSGYTPTLTLGVDAALGHLEDGEPVWEETEEAQAVAAAVSEARARGWSIGINFNQKIG